jgi:hypothetical protein
LRETICAPGATPLISPPGTVVRVIRVIRTVRVIRVIRIVRVIRIRVSGT